MAVVRFEQAVYGSFPFWSRGYALLASSPGCRPSWLAEFQAMCQRFGEPPAGDPPRDSIFSFPLSDGSRAVVGAFPQGQDDRGRPGAMAFHGLFLTRSEFARIGGNPFRVVGALQSRWQPDTTLSAGKRETTIDQPAEPIPDQEAQRIARALLRGERVGVVSDVPREPLVRRVWNALPRRARRRLSFATLAYAPTIGVSLAAFPRISEPSAYRTLNDLAEPPRSRRATWRRIGIATGIVMMLAGGWLLVWTWRRSHRPRPIPGLTAILPESVTPGPSRGDEAPPSRRGFAAGDDEEQRRIEEALQDIAARFGLSITEHDDATALMTKLSAELRYPGPWLSDEERQQLRALGTPAAARALRLDEHLRRVGSPRLLPEDFARGPLRWQLQVLAWSFRVTPHPGLTPAEVPAAIADSLGPREPVEVGPLSESFPALKSYASFFSRLRGR